VESKLGENGSSRKREIAFIIALDLSKQNTEKNIPLIDNTNKAKDFCSKGVLISILFFIKYYIYYKPLFTLE